MKEGVLMQRKKQVVTVTEIRNYLQKEEFEELTICSILFPGLFWLTFILKIPILMISLIRSILLIVPCLLALWGVVKSVYRLFQIKRNTCFKIRSDKLVSKAEVLTFQHGGATHRMHFGLGHYDVIMHNESDATDDLSHPLYGMSTKAVWQSSFVGDPFTLVSVGKRVHLVFNNKLFDIRDDL